MIETNDKYSWDTEKRALNIQIRGLDFVVLADLIFADLQLMIEPDNRKDYNEERFWAYAIVDDNRLCLCFTPRDDKIHLITIFKMHKTPWRKHYDKKN
ncbi:hypothetical protein FACS1894156_0690 [Bacteroidia bacterium]|nr:hypothetical protein FACS1894156_0690 [Bacteroidia bacterium]